MLCHQRAHLSGATCPQDRDLQMADVLAEEEGWRRCIKCSVLVEHLDACQHITCRCGAQFCYLCGVRWHHCECTMEQLVAHKRDAGLRRKARLERELAENAWLRNTLRLIEQFEADEQRARVARQRRQLVER